MNLWYANRRFIDRECLLSLFHKVTGGHRNSKGQIQYMAYCPAHETHHQSLAIAFESDGRPLFHCYSGCSRHDILAAVGLSVDDIFPDGALAHRIAPVTPPQSVQIDRTVLEIAKQTRESGGKLSKADLARERAAWLAAKKDQSWPKQVAK